MINVLNSDYMYIV